jgi:anti-sigma factor RsiW
MELDLVAFLDDRAAGDSRRQVEQHLATCAACRTRAMEFQHVSKLLDEFPAAGPSPYFDARLRSRLASEPRRSWWALWLPQPRLALAATALLLLGIWISALPPEVPPPTPVQAEEEFRMIKDMPVLENYDVLANLDALSEMAAD